MQRLSLYSFYLLLALANTAWAGNITLLLSENSRPYADFASALDEALAGSTWKINPAVQPENSDQPSSRADLIVSVGGKALSQALASSGTTPIIATLLPRQNYEKILAEAGKPRSRITAIYLDQPPARQASFLRHLLPDQKRIGILFSSETRSQAGHYRQVFKNAGLMLDSEDSDTPGTLLPAINSLLPRINVLLAIPDSTIYKRDNIKAILVSSYRHQRPVVAFSAPFVNAGALAAIYTTPAQIAQQTADLIIRSGTMLPSPMPPSLFAISINQNVASALEIIIPSEAAIRRAMLAEGEPR